MTIKVPKPPPVPVSSTVDFLARRLHGAYARKMREIPKRKIQVGYPTWNELTEQDRLCWYAVAEEVLRAGV